MQKKSDSEIQRFRVMVILVSGVRGRQDWSDVGSGDAKETGRLLGRMDQQALLFLVYSGIPTVSSKYTSYTVVHRFFTFYKKVKMAAFVSKDSLEQLLDGPF